MAFDSQTAMDWLYITIFWKPVACTQLSRHVHNGHVYSAILLSQLYQLY